MKVYVFIYCEYVMIYLEWSNSMYIYKGFYFILLMEFLKYRKK